MGKRRDDTGTEDASQEARRLCMLGLEAMRAGMFEDAVEHLHNALSLDPGRREIQVALVEALMESARFELAEKIARKALRRDPTSAALWYRLGYIHEVKDGGWAAEPYYLRALSMDANHSASLNSLASIYWRKGYRIRAAKLLQRAAMADPHHPETKSNLQAVFGFRPNRRDERQENKEPKEGAGPDKRGRVISLAEARRKKKKS